MSAAQGRWHERAALVFARALPAFARASGENLMFDTRLRRLLSTHCGRSLVLAATDGRCPTPDPR